jgi:hypothetical protein
MEENLLTGTKVMIATPMYGGQANMQYVISLCDVMYNAGKLDVSVKLEALSNESLIPKGRDTLVNKFLKSDYDYLFFIDADVGFSAQDFYDMVVMAKCDPDMEVITASYPKKDINWEFIKYAVDNKLADEKDLKKYSGYSVSYSDKEFFDVTKPLEIPLAATGFMLISRKILEDCAEILKDEYYFEEEEKMISFFKIGVYEHEYYSEDFMFCLMLQKMGRKIWLLPWVNLTHTGSYTFEGNFKRSAQIQYMKNMDKENK